MSSKYTRSKVRKKIPGQFAYIIDELLHADTEENKEDYYTEIICSIVNTGVAEPFITVLCRLIRQCCIDRLHIIGDIFDRGPRADQIMEELMGFQAVDIQWGNHDIGWIGAQAGNTACMANVVRQGISYNNFDLLEDGYGINPVSYTHLMIHFIISLSRPKSNVAELQNIDGIHRAFPENFSAFLVRYIFNDGCIFVYCTIFKKKYG